MNGNAEAMKAMGQAMTLAGKVGSNFWPAIKPSVISGRFDFLKFAKDSDVRDAIRRGFVPQAPDRPPYLGLDIGKVTRDKLSSLSVWDHRDLYQDFYRDVFGRHVMFPDNLMPDAPEKFGWISCIPGISNETSFQSGRLDMPHWKWTDQILDAVLNLNRGRDAWFHDFIVRVRPNWEADEDLKNICGKDMDERGTNVLMFRERWILGLYIFWLTGEHLDRKTVTLTGSRWSDGGVARVYFRPGDGEVSAGRVYPSSADGDWRFRQAVSLAEGE